LYHNTCTNSAENGKSKSPAENLPIKKPANEKPRGEPANQKAGEPANQKLRRDLVAATILRRQKWDAYG